MSRGAPRRSRGAPTLGGVEPAYPFFFIGVPQQFVNFGEVLPHFGHLNMSAIACHPLPPPEPWLRGIVGWR